MSFKIPAVIREKLSPIRQKLFGYPGWVGYDTDLIPKNRLMRSEGISNLEEWFRWAEEWKMYLCVYGNLESGSDVLEMGCGLGRIAYPLRFILRDGGTYTGFDIVKYKIDFLSEKYKSKLPNYTFVWADVFNSEYNQNGEIKPTDFSFPSQDACFDVVYAASVFTHMVPATTAWYLQEAARVLRPGGRCVFSFFLLDYYVQGQKRPLGFAKDYFNFDHQYESYGENFRTVSAEVPDRMTAYRRSFVEKLAADAGLVLIAEPVKGIWSGSSASQISAQDLMIFEKMRV